ncbi:hypothetical protein niasHT_004948 [Heterodera trifolii]|uniref:Poly(A) RNA polymerase mitochondrial-like central palm domain-containing protein n=1 Tax=Heterodera trifolii TaxID=157864 RepID=A0ABD2M8M3_9BILA
MQPIPNLSKCLIMELKVQNWNAKAIIDPNSAINFINPEFLFKLSVNEKVDLLKWGFQPKSDLTGLPYQFATYKGQPIPVYGLINVPIDIGNSEFETWCMVAKTPLEYDFILSGNVLNLLENLKRDEDQANNGHANSQNLQTFPKFSALLKPQPALIEVEKIINDRPLTYISEAEQTTILRPIDFISPYLDNEIQEIWSGEDLDPKDPDFIANPTSKQSLIAKFKVARQNADKRWSEAWDATPKIQWRRKPPGQCRAPARHEQGRATRRVQRSRSRDDNRAPPPQKDQPRQKFNWAPVPPKPQHAAPPPIMATTRPQPTKGWAPVDGVFHLSKWSMSQRCDGTDQHSNCSPVMASYLSDGLAQIYIPTLLHLFLAQILLDYSERWDAISNAIYTLTTSGLSPAELIQAAIAQKPLIGYGYTMGKKWTRGVPNPAKWQRMRARGSPQDLWWRFSDATTAVNVWKNHCRVAQAEIEMAAQMEAAVEIAEETCPENHPASEKLQKMREDIQTALQVLAHEDKKIITSKFVVIAEETTEALGYAINAFVTNCKDFFHSVLSGVNEAVILWTGSEAIRRGMPWANYIVELSPIVEKLIKLDKRFVWICPPRMAQHTATWLEYEDGFCSLALAEGGKGKVLVMPFTDSDVSDQGFLTGSGVSKTVDELEHILRGKKEERPSLDTRLQRFVEARAHRADEVNTNELNVNTSEPMVVVAACTSAVQHPIEHQEEIQIAMPQAEEVPWTWETKHYFVNDVKISATKMRELDEALEALILSQVPPPEERELKQNTFDAVRRILRRDTWEEFEICTAGSTRANTDLRSGDLDIVLMPKSGEPLSHERKLREIKFLVREFRLMKRQYPYRHCVTITKTKAPLVKIRTSEDVDIDITIDNSEALTNSNWLAEQMNDSKLWRLSRILSKSSK